MHPKQQLIDLQRQLFEQAYSEASYWLARQPRVVQDYVSVFENELPPTASITQEKQLIEAINHQNIVLYGDFHTCQQSQRGLLRLLRRYVETRDSQLVLALELLKPAHNSLVQDYLLGRVSETALLEGVAYFENWGFPWKNYRVLFDFARATGAKIVGVNKNTRGPNALPRRDREIASALGDVAQKYPSHPIVCLIGEGHLANEHLPKEILANPLATGREVIRIFSNLDKFYFQSSRHSGPGTTHIQLDKGTFCVLNSPPWLKWQSYALWEEYRESAVSDSDELMTEDGIDVEYQVLSLCRTLLEFFEIKTPRHPVDSCRIIDLAKGFDEIDVLGMEPHISRALWDGLSYEEHKFTALLSDPTINNMSDIAAQHTFAISHHYGKEPFSGEERFFKRVLKFSFCTLGALVLNPDRKFVGMGDLEMGQKRRRKLPPFARSQQTAASQALHFFKSMQDKTASKLAPNKFQSFEERDRECSYQISANIGTILGMRALHGMKAASIPYSELANLMFGDVSGDASPSTSVFRLMKRFQESSVEIAA